MCLPKKKEGGDSSFLLSDWKWLTSHGQSFKANKTSLKMSTRKLTRGSFCPDRELEGRDWSITQISEFPAVS